MPQIAQYKLPGIYLTTKAQKPVTMQNTSFCINIPKSCFHFHYCKHYIWQDSLNGEGALLYQNTCTEQKVEDSVSLVSDWVL